MRMEVTAITVSTVVECVVDFARRWVMVDEEVTVKSIYFLIDELSSKHRHVSELFIRANLLFIM